MDWAAGLCPSAPTQPITFRPRVTRSASPTSTFILPVLPPSGGCAPPIPPIPRRLCSKRRSSRSHYSSNPPPPTINPTMLAKLDDAKERRKKRHDVNRRSHVLCRQGRNEPSASMRFLRTSASMRYMSLYTACGWDTSERFWDSMPALHEDMEAMWYPRVLGLCWRARIIMVQCWRL